MSNAPIFVRDTLTSALRQLEIEPGKPLRWYTCGPTVYDSAHLGHARAYSTVDTMRRILTDYFRANVVFAQNITDLDNKTIDRARRAYLVQQAKDKGEDTIALATEAWEAAIFVAQLDQTSDGLVKLAQLHKDHVLFQTRALDEPLKRADELVMGELLDARGGRDQAPTDLYKAHAERYEQEFFRDMRELGVRDPDIVTRVSDYVPHIVAYIQRILDNGFAYAHTDGSVYFDMQAFRNKGFDPCQLAPASVKFTSYKLDVVAKEVLKQTAPSDSRGRKSTADFALWKANKTGEPSWPSPWGPGRPGWHIECSSMANDVLGETFDIHSGGIDLAFPHHNNETAQCEAHNNKPGWVKHWWHVGHLHIKDSKMSKSLKNFISIREMLHHYSGRVLRLMFLAVPWYANLSYNSNVIEAAAHLDKEVVEFFQNCAACIRVLACALKQGGTWSDTDRAFHTNIVTARQEFDLAMRSNLDYTRGMQVLLTLMSETNKYVKMPVADANLIRQSSRWITDMLLVFGVDYSVESTVKTDLLPDVLDATVLFRQRVRAEAREMVLTKARDAVQAIQRATNILTLCDDMRDKTCVHMGVRIDDDGPHGSTWKLADATQLIRERDEKRQRVEARKLAAQDKQAALEQKRMVERKRASQDARTYFATTLAAQFGSFDVETGRPLTDATGAVLSKSATKAAAKLWTKQEKLHDEYKLRAMALKHNVLESSFA